MYNINNMSADYLAHNIEYIFINVKLACSKLYATEL